MKEITQLSTARTAAPPWGLATPCLDRADDSQSTFDDLRHLCSVASQPDDAFAIYAARSALEASVQPQDAVGDGSAPKPLVHARSARRWRTCAGAPIAAGAGGAAGCLADDYQTGRGDSLP
jgi:hypothetical protein